MKFYFDKTSGLLLRMVHYTDTPLGLNPTQVDFADYRAVDGVKTPYRWTHRATEWRVHHPDRRRAAECTDRGDAIRGAETGAHSCSGTDTRTELAACPSVDAARSKATAEFRATGRLVGAGTGRDVILTNGRTEAGSGDPAFHVSHCCSQDSV